MTVTVTALQQGVWGVVATPFTGGDRSVDRESLTRLAAHYAPIGAVGLTVLGVFGEAARLDGNERRAVVETVRDAVALPLVVGVTALGTAPAIEEARAAREAAGDRLAAVMVQVNTTDRDTLQAHLGAIHEATGAPIVVQDYPVVSGVSISAGALVAALRELPFIAAVKAEAPPTPVAIAALTGALDVPVFGGLGGIGLLDELAAGAAGAMTGFSYPEGLVACVEAWGSGGYAAAREAFLPYLPLVNFEQQVRIALAVRKECLHARGLIADPAVRPPAAPMPESLRPQLVRHLAAVPGPR
ncbi:dihydrodipicolinate synthase family protein [Pseudonocardia sp. TRM90224]|uniref:dihydrodipicolinate synthase family protein n=1 Tax=Pseudonocardia sp. TRM90224 TaxID=2812678 RepID=UPI001E5DB1D7|nr:dihydrodipicolinate synthase family protein [Pseudonocardia sp. TRM90224]